MKKIVFFFFITALSTLALFSSTDVITMFNGSHTINSLESDVNDVECAGCHQRMQDQLENSSVHSDFKCEECHRVARIADGKMIKYAAHNQSGITVGNESHAAYTPRCLDCHEENGLYYNDTWIQKKAPTAIAFNETGYGSDYSAHKPFVEQALEWRLSKGENEACIACHTNYSMEIEFKRPEWLQFYVNKKSGGIEISNINYGSTNTTNIHVSGSGAKHEFKQGYKKGIECESCHSDVWRAANQTIEDKGNYGATNASHVCWQFEKSGSGSFDSPMHNTTCVYSEYGATCYGLISDSFQSTPDYYNNITEYCLLSCHNPRIGGNTNSDFVAQTFKDTTHAAHRVSCYDCHNESIEPYVEYYRLPNGDYVYCDSKHKVSDITTEPLFLHGETCIACKRDNVASSGTYKTWTEPNNTMYHTDGYYI
ncbi:MAG: hypothetical protein R6U44_05870 [Archaeoglobaceae archaeon]